MSTCANCRGPVGGPGYAGRARGGAPAPVYCCFGCLSVGEAACDGGSCETGLATRGAGFRLGVGVLVVGQSMAFGLALNVHDDVPPEVRSFAQWCILAGTLVVAALLGGPLLVAAGRELKRGRLTIEALFLLTATGALAASVQSHLRGHGSIYYEVVSVLLVVYTLGKVIGARARAAALTGARAWGDRLGWCRLVEGADSRAVPVGEVRPGDVVEVRPGELFAIDGVVREGVGFVSEAVVTGEPFSAVRRPGDRVLAGSVSADATFRVVATAPGHAREIDRLITAVEEARDRPLSLQNRADRLARWFLPLVVLTAIGTFAYWTFLTPAGYAVGLFNSMSVLLVACPCVIGLATPIVIWSALSRLAERGVIVRTGDAVERLATADQVLFDKTGTLTEDRFALVDIETTASGDERAKLLGWLSLVQAQSAHPIAKPFADLPRPFAPGAEPRVASLTTVPGCGVVAELVGASGERHEVKVGTAEWVAGDLPPRPPSPLLSSCGSGLQSPTEPPDEGKGRGGMQVCAAVNGELVAVATVAERLRESAPRALEHLTALGLPVAVLTGDHTERAQALGLPAPRGGLLPDDKRKAVEEAKAAGGRPMFVGDGINDASALAAAHVGVALASGTDLAVSAAPVTLYGGDLRALPWAVELSREAVRAVRRNLFRALAYNLVGMTLAACGVLHPVVAALLMVVSSLTLVFSSTRVGCGHAGAEEPTPPAPLPAGRGEKEPPEPSSERGAPAVPRASFSPLPAGRGAGGVGRFAFVHALTLALQGVVFVLLLAPLRDPRSAALMVGAFAVAGVLLARAWRRWGESHAVDMCLGMLTLGNLGMLLGWWADAGFAPLPDGACCACADVFRGGEVRPWMWVGMLAFANAAMLWLRRGPAPGREHLWAMFTGGNVGMVVGMLAGGRAAPEVHAGSMVGAVALRFVGMTVGMCAGMLAGAWLVERLIVGVRAVRSGVLLDEVERRQPEPDRDDRVPDVARR